MKAFLGSLVLVVVLSLGAASALADPSTVSLPKLVTVVPPAPEIPHERARYSGWWYGKWNAVLPHILIVEEIPVEGWPTVVYGWGQSIRWKPGHKRIPATWEGKELVVRLDDGISARYRMVDGKLKGSYMSRETSASVEMHMIEALPLPAP